MKCVKLCEHFVLFIPFILTSKFKCEICDKRLMRKSNLAEHMRVFHSPLLGKIKCPCCEFLLSNRSNAYKHCLRAHNMILPARYLFDTKEVPNESRCITLYGSPIYPIYLTFTNIVSKFPQQLNWCDWAIRPHRLLPQPPRK